MSKIHTVFVPSVEGKSGVIGLHDCNTEKDMHQIKIIVTFDAFVISIELHSSVL